MTGDGNQRETDGSRTVSQPLAVRRQIAGTTLRHLRLVEDNDLVAEAQTRDGLPNLSVEEDYPGQMLRTGWRSYLDVPVFYPDMLPSITSFVDHHLRGRWPKSELVIKDIPNSRWPGYPTLRVGFQVEDDSFAVQSRSTPFEVALALMVGGNYGVMCMRYGTQPFRPPDEALPPTQLRLVEGGLTRPPKDGVGITT
jgi:hypothetical protein